MHDLAPAHVAAAPRLQRVRRTRELTDLREVRTLLEATRRRHLASALLLPAHRARTLLLLHAQCISKRTTRGELRARLAAHSLRMVLQLLLCCRHLLRTARNPLEARRQLRIRRDGRHLPKLREMARNLLVLIVLGVPTHRMPVSLQRALSILEICDKHRP